MGKLEEIYQREGKTVPSFPDLGIKILRACLTKPEADFWDLVDKEEDLKGFLLDTANLPRYRREASPINTLRMAILILGESLAKNLILGYLSKILMRPTFTEFNFHLFWARALSNLTFASLLGNLVESLSPHLYPASLLMDYGVVLLYLANPQAYLQVLKRRSLGKNIYEAEEEVFGVNHAELSAEFFEQYALPRRFILSLRYHHRDPENLLPLEMQRDLKMLRMIDHGVGSFFTNKREERFNHFKKIAKEFIKEKEIEVIKEIFPKFANSFLEIFKLDEFKLLTFSEYAKEVERSLTKLDGEAFKGEVLIDPKELIKKYEEERYAFLKEKEEILEKYYQLLEKYNQESITDRSTGLYSFSYFVFRLKDELLRSRRYIYPFSFLLIDLDLNRHLYEIQSLQSEEEAVKMLTNDLLNLLRRCDLIFYEGAGRIFVLLPHTPVQGAMVVARKLYQRIDEKLKSLYPKYQGPFIAVLTYNPKEINPKKDIPDSLLVNLLKNGLELMKKKGKKKIALITIERDFQPPQ